MRFLLQRIIGETTMLMDEKTQYFTEFFFFPQAIV